MNVDVSRSNESSPSHHRRVNDTDTGTESAFSSATEGNARDSSAPHERLHGIARKKHRAGGADNANTTSSTSLLLQVMGVIVGMCVLAGIGVSFYLTHVQPVQSTNGGRGGGRDSGDAVSFHRHVPMHVLKKIERDRITGMEKQLQNKEPHMLNLPGEKETLGFGAALQALAGASTGRACVLACVLCVCGYLYHALYITCQICFFNSSSSSSSFSSTFPPPSPQWATRWKNRGRSRRCHRKNEKKKRSTCAAKSRLRIWRNSKQ